MNWFHKHKKTKSMRFQLSSVVKPHLSLPMVDNWGYWDNGRGHQMDALAKPASLGPAVLCKEGTHRHPRLTFLP